MSKWSQNYKNLNKQPKEQPAPAFVKGTPITDEDREYHKQVTINAHLALLHPTVDDELVRDLTPFNNLLETHREEIIDGLAAYHLSKTHEGLEEHIRWVSFLVVPRVAEVGYLMSQRGFDNFMVELQNILDYYKKK